mmetsp:Transcript_104882/g.306322  ORF Transcript_104882/g.306322 Transcript_104882/m.306322 type:complete len:246 (+) Transcript_104882:54-791(+)
MQCIRSRSARCRSGLAGLTALAVLACAALAGLESQLAWTLASGARTGTRRGHGQLLAEGAAAPAPAPSEGGSYALVKVTEESKMTTAGVLGGLAGLLIGGVWVGGALFAASSYFAKKEDSDVSKALKGVASGSLEVLNFGAAINEKYMVTDKLGSAVSSALEGAKSSPDSKGAATTVSGFLSGLGEAFQSLDNDVGIKDTLGTLASGATDLAFQAVDKAVELNNEYKISDQISEKVQEATSSKAK